MLKKLYRKYKELILYVVFGVLTTAVNFLIFYPVTYLLSFSGIGDKLNVQVSNVIAWIGAVIFAFFTNKKFVFESRNSETKFVIAEFLKFGASRITTLATENGLLFLGGLVWTNTSLLKIAVTVLTIILNYIFSKLFVFRKKKQDDEGQDSVS